MDPMASGGDVAALEDRLTGEAMVASTRYVDQEETYEEFTQLYAAQPELVEAVSPAVMPSSFRIVLDGPPPMSAVGDLVADLNARPGVYEVVVNDCLAAGEPADSPTLVALVRDDGWLVTVDLETADQRELYFHGDPGEVHEGDISYFIDGVDLSPDGQWVYFSTCCEPAVGTTYRIPVEGGEPERLLFDGAYPRVNPAGTHVAVVAIDRVVVRPVEGGPTIRFEAGHTPSGLSWSPDGTQLAYVLSSPEDDQTDLQVLAFDGTALTLADTGKPADAGTFASWTPEGTVVVSSGGPADDDRRLSQDASYQWLLWVDEEGVVREQSGHQSSNRVPIEALPRALAADW